MVTTWVLLSRFVSALAAAIVRDPFLQMPGYCEITSPTEGEAVEGIVSVRGSAYHPSFVRYDLWFGYDDDVTGTWFPLSEDLVTPVRQGRLGLWDTSLISDGDYQLRLRVWKTDGLACTVIVGHVHVGSRLLESPQPAPVPIEEEAVAQLPTPSATPQVPRQIMQEPEVKPKGVTEGLLTGGVAGAAALGLLAGYVSLRNGYRLRAARRRRPLASSASRAGSRKGVG